MAKNKENAPTLEQGNIYFFYRPKVEEEEPKGRSDLQRMYMVMSPEGKNRFRLAVIGRKQLPDPGESGGQRNWGFIETVSKSPQSILDELAGETYKTKKRGTRRLPAARPAGEGVYRLVRHDSHCHLVYALELPKEPGEVQEELRIEEEASYIVSIKNPETGSPRGVGLSEDQQAHFPRKLLERFHGRRFADPDPPDFLDYEGAEFVLVAAAEDVKEELGIELQAEDESAHSADIFKELRLDRSKRPVEPLFSGVWK